MKRTKKELKKEHDWSSSSSSSSSDDDKKKKKKKKKSKKGAEKRKLTREASKKVRTNFFKVLVRWICFQKMMNRKVTKCIKMIIRMILK